MRCEDFLENLSALIDGELGPEDRSAIESHLRDCPGCRLRASEYRALWRLLGEDAEVQVGPEFLPAVQARVRESKAARPRWSTAVKGAAAAAATVLLVLGLLFFAQRRGPDESGGSAAGPGRPSLSQDFAEVEKAVQEDPEILEILNHLEALEEIELLENLDILERMDDFSVEAADDLAEAAEHVVLDPELPVALGE